MADMTTEQAVDIMAADLLRALLESHGGDSWEESYPDVGLGDWDSILRRAKAIVDNSVTHWSAGSLDTVAAYEHLVARSAAWERGDDGTR